MRVEKKRVNQERMGGGEELRGLKGGETVNRTYCIPIKNLKEQLNWLTFSDHYMLVGHH